MALTICGDCGGQVSTSAGKCPHCGRPSPTKPLWIGSVVGVGLGLVVALIALLLVRHFLGLPWTPWM